MNESEEIRQEGPRWRYLGLAALIFVVGVGLMAGVQQLPRLFPTLLAGEPATPTRRAALPTATPVPVVHEPTITHVAAQADDTAGTIRFWMEAEVPPDRAIDEVLLWYDTEVGHRLQRTQGPFGSETTITHRLDVAVEGLTRTVTTTQPLDYWWLVRDTAGAWDRAGGAVALGPELQSQVAVVQPTPPAVGFTWTISESQHFRFHYAPATAAERDRFRIGGLAEASLDMISTILEMPFDGTMDIYLVPRVFWQGGAAYGDKIQLISYLDRNYTGIETWSYFTHEGTHALAQDLLQPKEEGQGGPDGVLVEGLAVWASDGHYREEPIDAWAAVVAGSESYLPLDELRAGPFYDFQHETSYIEAASFVKFLIDQYGLETLKELYGRATGDEAHDDELVRALYDVGYEELEGAWLDHLAGLAPTREQAETWHLKVRSFDLMRRYETDLDPDARILPGLPTDWQTDTLNIFLQRAGEPENVVLETALIAAQEQLYGGDPAAAAVLLDNVEAALNAGGSTSQPLLAPRRAIVDLLALQDQAILRADPDGYRDTLAPGSPLATPAAIEAALAPPFGAYRQEVVRLDLTLNGDEGATGEGLVRLHARLAKPGEAFADDGRLFAVTFVETPEGWRLWSREPAEPSLPPPPAATENGS
jgi:hypothetical protein